MTDEVIAKCVRRSVVNIVNIIISFAHLPRLSFPFSFPRSAINRARAISAARPGLLNWPGKNIYLRFGRRQFPRESRQRGTWPRFLFVAQRAGADHKSL